jgi:hypothetical protein
LFLKDHIGNNIWGGIDVDKDFNKKEELNLDAIEHIAIMLEKAKLGEYTDMMSSPKKLITRNFIAGLSRGFGMAIGFTVLGAIGLYFLQKLVLLNLPFLGTFIAEIVKIVQDRL